MALPLRITVVLTCALLPWLLVRAALAEPRSERVTPAPVPAFHSANVDLLNPVALLSQAIAKLIGAEVERVMLGGAIRYGSSFAARTAVLRPPSILQVAFSNRADAAKVSLLLAESQLRVRLAEDLQLRCELSSRDEMNTDPELTFDVGVQFKFK